MKTPAHLALLAAGAFGLALIASSAIAQDYPDEDTSYSDEDSNSSDEDANYDEDSTASDEDVAYADEEIEVTAPRVPDTDARGLPQRVSLSAGVAYGDLDLRTNRGARELRARIRHTAYQLCTEIDANYPGPGGETQACLRDAQRNAMNEAADIISDARGVAYNDEY